MRKSFVVLGLQILSFNLNAQYLEKLEIIPANPTVEDSIRISYELSFAWNGAIKKSSNQYITEDSLFYDGCYFNPGLAQTESYVFDTIYFGKLSLGLHPFKFTRNIVWFPNDTFCNNIGYSVTFDTIINVAAISKVLSAAKVLCAANLHPNPATATITLSGTEPGSTATITNLHGQVLLQSEIRSPQSNINIAHLPAGFYFCTLQNGGQHKVLRFVRE